jgi:hypothetical protein
MKNTTKITKASEKVFRHQQKNPVIIINKNIKITIKVKIKDTINKNKIRKIILEEKDILTEETIEIKMKSIFQNMIEKRNNTKIIKMKNIKEMIIIGKIRADTDLKYLIIKKMEMILETEIIILKDKIFIEILINKIEETTLRRIVINVEVISILLKTVLRIMIKERGNHIMKTIINMKGKDRMIIKMIGLKNKINLKVKDKMKAKIVRLNSKKNRYKSGDNKIIKNKILKVDGDPNIIKT